MKKKCLIISLAFYLLPFTFYLLPSAYAQDQQVQVTPSEFRIEANPPTDIRAPFTIENLSDSSIIYTIGYKLFSRVNSQNGSVVFLNKTETPVEQDPHIFNKMQVVDDDNLSYDSIELGPKQSKRLQLRITLPTHEPIGDYYFTLLFLPQSSSDQNVSNDVSDSQNSSSSLQAGIGINVLLALGPKATPQGNIDTFSTPWLRQSGPVPFDIKVNNTGIHYNTPRGEIIITNMFGQAVGKIQIPPTVILAGTARSLFGVDKSRDTKDKDESTSMTTGSQATWRERFLLGIYTAIITLSMSDQGPVYTRTIHFISLPLIALLVIMVISLALILTYRRIKHHYKNRI